MASNLWLAVKNFEIFMLKKMRWSFSLYPEPGLLAQPGFVISASTRALTAAANPVPASAYEDDPRAVAEIVERWPVRVVYDPRFGVLSGGVFTPLKPRPGIAYAAAW